MFPMTSSSGPAAGVVASRMVIEEEVVEIKFHSCEYDRTPMGRLGYTWVIHPNDGNLPMRWV